MKSLGFCKMITLLDWAQAKTAGEQFARDDKEPGPSWGKQLPGERLRETAPET
jgi:hypothetical protein